MAKYVCDLDLVWNLPVGTGCFNSIGDEDCDLQGYCSIGLVMAGILGKDISWACQETPEECELSMDLNRLGFSAMWGWEHSDLPIIRDKEDPEVVRERNVRIILQKCIEENLIDLKNPLFFQELDSTKNGGIKEEIQVF